MATMRCESIDKSQELESLCRWGIRVSWHLSLLWGALVSLLSWTAGATAETAVIRGLVSFVALGLLGWGANVVLIHGGQGENDGSAGDTKETSPTGEGNKTSVGGPSAASAVAEAKGAETRAAPNLQGGESEAASPNG